MNSTQTIVIKYGGAAMQSTGLQLAAMSDVRQIAASGADVVLVHGGGPELSALQEKLGIETKFLNGLRYSDEATVDAALMALCGKVNKDLVRLLENEGQKAAGISGIDGGILRCVKQSEPDLGFVGEIKSVDAELLRLLIGNRFVPVVSTAGLGEDGLAYNINADTAAGRIAAELTADSFITLSDVPGVLRDVNDAGSLIREIRAGEIEGLIDEGVIAGGMIPKVRGLADSLRNGARSAAIVDGRVPHALAAYLGGSIIGTTIIL